MSEDTPAATRRRWITLAELVAVAGVVIAGLTFWSSWSDRRDARVAAEAAAGADAREKARLEVTGEVRDGGRSILLRDERHDIQQVRFTFPAGLGVPAQEPAGDPAIDADWISSAMLKLTDGGADDRTGRLPVLASITYWDGDRARQTALTFDLIWRTEGRMLQGRTFKLEGLRLRQRGGSTAGLERLWRKP
jgi:hypothetical protein